MTTDYYKAYFESLAQRGIKLTDAQKSWYIKKHEVLQDAMKKEYPSFPEEAFEVNMNGLYYAAHVSAARNSKRILHIPEEPTLRVHTSWDLGFSDHNCIIFFQIVGKEVHIIDFIEGSGHSLADYCKMVHKKDYHLGTHLGPHDLKVHEYSTGVSRIDTAAKLGVQFVLVPDVSLADGIDCVRNNFSKFFFHNNDNVLKLVHHLENYTQKWDSSLGMWSGRPSHDEHSHCCDAFRYLCLGLSLCTDESQSVTQSQADSYFRTHGRRI
jgi:hypothetical protein